MVICICVHINNDFLFNRLLHVNVIFIYVYIYPNAFHMLVFVLFQKQRYILLKSVYYLLVNFVDVACLHTRFALKLYSYEEILPQFFRKSVYIYPTLW